MNREDRINQLLGILAEAKAQGTLLSQREIAENMYPGELFVHSGRLMIKVLNKAIEMGLVVKQDHVYSYRGDTYTTPFYTTTR